MTFSLFFLPSFFLYIFNLFCVSDLLSIFSVLLVSVLASIGQLWVDGGAWQFSLLPQGNAGISAATCCIKSVFDPSTWGYIWLGEHCNAPLPAVCEHQPSGNKMNKIQWYNAIMILCMDIVCVSKLLFICLTKDNG